MNEDVVVIVPTRNSATTLQACLESLRGQTCPVLVVVVDNNSTDETPAIAHELADLFFSAGPERSAQRNAGAAATSESIVGFIDSDMVLSSTVVAEVVAAIRNGAASVVIPEETVGEGFWTKVSAYERSFYEGNNVIEAPRFFPRSVFEKVGGFDEAMTGAEDWDLGIRTLEAGPRVHIHSRITHHEGRIRYFTICRKKAYYAPGVALFVRKHGIRNIGVTNRPWLRQPRALLRPLGLGLLVLKTGQAMSMVIGMAWLRLGRRLELPNRSPSTTRHRDTSS